MSMSRLIILLCIAVALLSAMSSARSVPTFTMLNFDVNQNGTLIDPQQLLANLQKLKQRANIDGILCDVWWGTVEKTPKQYDFSAYLQIVSIARSVGLKVGFIMSFHQCGGNVGDACDIPLPGWLLAFASVNQDIFYRDREGNINMEYLSLGADHVALVGGRTPIQMYSDFVAAFAADVLASSMDVVVEVQIGQGPAGELRYPSYPLAHWQFPGVGEFQCYDKYMLASLASAAEAAGHPEWSHGGPDDAGTYSSLPSQTSFFSDNTYNNYASDYGRFFLSFYLNALLNHSHAVLGATTAALGQYRSQLKVSGKVAGIHWQYKTNSHAAECTAGYTNTNGVDPYRLIADVYQTYGVQFDFTCLEMLDSEQPSSCACSPQYLVAQSHNAANAAGVSYSGENALPRFDATAYGTIEMEARAQGNNLAGFYYLRLGPELLQDQNLNTFAGFVHTMHNL